MPFPSSLQCGEYHSTSTFPLRIQNDEQIIVEEEQEQEKEEEQENITLITEDEVPINNNLFDDETNQLIVKVNDFKQVLSNYLSLQFSKIEERERLKTKMLEWSKTEKIYNQFHEEFTKMLESNKHSDFLLNQQEDERQTFIKKLLSLNEQNIGLLNEEIKLLNEKIAFIKQTLYYEDDQINKTCGICYDHPVQYCLNPCGHLYCKNCSKKITTVCFFCRKQCTNRIKMMFGMTRN